MIKIIIKPSDLTWLSYVAIIFVFLDLLLGISQLIFGRSLSILFDIILFAFAISYLYKT